MIAVGHMGPLNYLVLIGCDHILPYISRRRSRSGVASLPRHMQ